MVMLVCHVGGSCGSYVMLVVAMAMLVARLCHIGGS